MKHLCMFWLFSSFRGFFFIFFFCHFAFPTGKPCPRSWGGCSCPAGLTVTQGRGWGSPAPNTARCHKSRFSSDIGEEFSALRVVRLWHRVSREAVGAPSLEVSKVKLDKAGSNLAQWKCLESLLQNFPSLCGQGGWPKLQAVLAGAGVSCGCRWA